ncbi:heavy metal translocating P-type ATPase [Streptococcus phocae]|uniref:P-type Cu(+) transporter n=1 Tax=Streptococcus phocae TaxID=119224 RepID=A0A0P6SJC9_9STRE|nr:heavy metal translocating P-type ATPase [Streptococcus phocae]KPJ22356.1 ATPase P [Streptococcus phocae]
MGKETFLIDGMTCASCAMTVEKAVNHLPEVDKAVVNLTTEKMTVSYRTDSLPATAIIDAVVAAGYKAELFNPQKESSYIERQEQQATTIWKQFIWSAVFTLPLLYLAMGGMFDGFLPNFLAAQSHPVVFAVLQLILTVPVLYLSRFYYFNGFRALFKGHPNMDSLVALATSGAFIYSTYALVSLLLGQADLLHHLYFESVGVILTLITLGHYFEHRSKGRTSQAIKQLMSLKVQEVRVWRDNQFTLVPLEEVTVQDTVLIQPGEKVAVDGRIIEGTSTLDESLLTGESLPVSKKTDDSVFAGTINGQGALKVQPTRLGDDTVLSHIIQLVEDAQQTKAPIAAIADKVSGIFVPIVIALALATAFFWLVIMKESFEFSLTAAIAVLAIACPCALGLATPTAIMVGSGRAAEKGILFKGGDVLERAHQIQTIVLDKTGTITQGKPTLETVIPVEGNANRALQLAASIEQYSQHPLGQAIVAAAKEQAVDFLTVTEFRAMTGMGVEAKHQNHLFTIGNKELMQEQGIALEKSLDAFNQASAQGKTVVFFAKDNSLQALFVIADPIKADSPAMITALQELGIKTVMLTGDNDRTARYIAEQVGIEQVFSQVLPDQKAQIIADLKGQGQIVGMVGDGINDAPALAVADVGIAMGSGTDIAIESADIILMKPQMMDLVTSLGISRLTIKIVKENLFWAFVYNILMIPVAMGFLYLFGGPLLNPMLAGFAMSLSSVSVVLNALRLKTISITKEN